MKYPIGLIGFLLTLSACQPYVKETPRATGTFEPTEEVAILECAPSGRQYVALGELEVTARVSQEDALGLLLAQAKELGADAIILCGLKTPETVDEHLGSTPEESTSRFRIPLRTLRATAIKYSEL